MIDKHDASRANGTLADCHVKVINDQPGVLDGIY